MRRHWLKVAAAVSVLAYVGGAVAVLWRKPGAEPPQTRLERPTGV